MTTDGDGAIESTLLQRLIGDIEREESGRKNSDAYCWKSFVGNLRSSTSSEGEAPILPRSPCGRPGGDV
jgi:hypothetical protein